MTEKTDKIEKEFVREIKLTKKITDGKDISFDTLCYIILKTLELKDKGLTSKFFESKKTIFKIPETKEE